MKYAYLETNQSPGKVRTVISNGVSLVVISDEGENLVSETGNGGIEVSMYVGTRMVDDFIDMKDSVDVVVSRKERS